MRECDNSKIHKSSNFLLSICLINNVGHLTTSTTTTRQHFATLHHTSPNYTSQHLSTLHFLSFTLHYPLIWLNPYFVVLFIVCKHIAMFFLSFLRLVTLAGVYRGFPLCLKTQGHLPIYTGCPRRNGQNFGRVFLMLNYTDITQNTYIQS